MKTLLLASILSLYSIGIVKTVEVTNEHIQSSYCIGWEDGWADGYCYNKYYCIAPLAPLCPIRRINEEDSYRGGYQRGFVAGRNKANE